MGFEVKWLGGLVLARGHDARFELESLDLAFISSLYDDAGTQTSQLFTPAAGILERVFSNYYALILVASVLLRCAKFST